MRRAWESGSTGQAGCETCGEMRVGGLRDWPDVPGGRESRPRWLQSSDLGRSDKGGLRRGCVRGHLRNHLFPEHRQFGGQKGASLLWPLGGGPESMGTWTPSSRLQLPQPGSGSCP